jgi:tRNA threonylcarbamoyl adenosine modification protein (Sua5/YciO/YrdC/YwlC family)
MSKATVYYLDNKHPNTKKLGKVVESLKDGEVIVYPTDTVYGLGCDIKNKKAIDKIYSIKNLGPKHLMSFICSDLSQASNYVNINNEVFTVLRRILPGPYTIILEANREVPKVLLKKRKTIGIRIPASPVARFLVEKLGRPIVSTSVSDQNGDNILDPEDIYKHYGSHVKMIVDQGIIGDESSTVLLYGEDGWEIIREGKGEVDFL